MLGCPMTLTDRYSQRRYPSGCGLRRFVALIPTVAEGGFALFLEGVTVSGGFGIGG
jgi:hypothetical protein